MGGSVRAFGLGPCSLLALRSRYIVAANPNSRSCQITAPKVKLQSARKAGGMATELQNVIIQRFRCRGPDDDSRNSGDAGVWDICRSGALHNLSRAPGQTLMRSGGP